MEYADFVEKCVKEYKETENEFVYQLIDPFCETVVEKKLSKAELKQILEKGMQKSISLDKVKQAREEMNDLDYLINDAKYSDWETRICNVDILVNEFYEIMDKLIAESED